METYYKILERTYESYKYNFTYEKGLNTITGYSRISEKETQNGFWLTKLSHIEKFYMEGTILATIKLPINDLDFKMTIHDNYWRSNKIIICEEYSLYDIQTYEKFGLDILKNTCIVKFASRDNNIDFLNWWLNSGLELKYNEDAIEMASSGCHIKILDWWLNSGLELRYDKLPIMWASSRGHVKVLDW